MMLLKNYLLFIVIAGIVNTSAAQKRQNVYFLKNDNREVFNKDSADFIRIIQEPDSGEVNFNLLEFYPDGKKKIHGTVSSFLPRLKYEGQLISYYPSGKRLSVANYQNNKLIGSTYVYFENGKLYKTYEIKVALPEKNKPYTHWADTLIMYQADTTGRVLVENGNGHVTEPISSYNGALLEGDYKDGYKHGTWTMKSNDGISSYKEAYANGKFISGENELNGIRSTYKTIEEMPTMKGGIEQFYYYLKRTVRYPADAQRDNIQGKVYLSFIVELDGSLTDIKITRGVHPSLDDEAQRVVKRSPKWIPGKVHGFPVRAKFNIPISFSLSGANFFPQPDNRFNSRSRF